MAQILCTALVSHELTRLFCRWYCFPFSLLPCVHPVLISRSCNHAVLFSVVTPILTDHQADSFHSMLTRIRESDMAKSEASSPSTPPLEAQLVNYLAPPQSVNGRMAVGFCHMPRRSPAVLMLKDLHSRRHMPGSA